MVLSEYFSGVQDFRVKGRCLHLLSDILALVLCGVLADCDNFTEISDYGEDNLDFLQKELDFKFLCGIPSEDTLERVFRYLCPQELSKSYNLLLKDISLAKKQLIIDGKELRSTIPKGKKHSLVQMVNVWVDEHNLSFGQQKVAKKSNEITAIPELLKLIDCKDSIITIDAIACQKEIISQIREQEADYIITLKKNQKGLYEELMAEMERQKETLEVAISRDKGHGRAELRKVYVSENLTFMEQTENWRDLNSVILVERSRWEQGKETHTKTLYISSLKGESPKQMGHFIRNHWAIENRLHWQLDVSFREDASHSRQENASINLHLFRKWAMFLLKKNPEKISIKRKRKKAARSNKYLKNLF